VLLVYIESEAISQNYDLEKRIFLANNQIFIMRYVLLLWFFLVFREGMGYQVFEKDCMGAKFIVLIDEDDKLKAERGATAAFKEGERLNMALSDYEGSSELVRFSESSQTGRKFTLSDDLFRVLSHGQELSRKSDGCFDVTIGPLSRLWRIARFRKKMPAEEKLSAARSRVGYQDLHLYAKDRTGTLQAPDMVLDLGGIAKGYAADRMLKTLRKRGLNRCLIDAGGDLVMGDAPRDTKGWKVEVGGRKHPALPTLHLTNVAVATSGDIEQFVTLNGKRFSHLIDPRTGLGLTTQCQVTVIAPSGMEADSLASAFLVMGSRKSKEYIEDKTAITAFYLQKKDSETTFRLWGRKERK
jgi:FAD:protein FMN transferase